MSFSKPEVPKKSRAAKNPPSKTPKMQKSWSMYPALHDSVKRLLDSDNLTFTFLTTDSAEGSIEEHDTNIIGRFRCFNKACTQAGWTSRIVATTIRMYPGQSYNAWVYHQRCKGCGRLSKPIPDESYAERIAYRLKKWSGVQMEQPPYTAGTRGRPHESALCEGCRYGRCQLSGSRVYTAAR